MISNPAIAAAEVLRRLHLGVVVPDYEQLLVQTYSNFIKPGSVAIDVGAHAGRHTEHLARFAGDNGKVVAFEPIPHLFAKLKKTFKGNKVVDLRPFALSRFPGTLPFKIVRNLPELSGLKERVFDRAVLNVETIIVTVSTLDEQLADLDRVDYIKIDVEGAEIDCLHGAVNTLTKFRPLVSVEYGEPSYSVYGHQASTLLEFALDNDYVLSDFFTNVIDDHETWQAVCNRSYWDYMLVPKERVAWWQALFG
mgnify:CR=1 FL=1